MVTKIFTCAYCGREFERIAYPSAHKWNQIRYKESYCSKRCAMIAAREKFRPTQGIILSNVGRLMVRVLNHPNRNKNNQVPLAHLVVEEILGRYLNPNEVIHHIDENPLNNEPDNLKVMDVKEHLQFHANQRRDINGRFAKVMS